MHNTSRRYVRLDPIEGGSPPTDTEIRRVIVVILPTLRGIMSNMILAAVFATCLYILVPQESSSFLHPFLSGVVTTIALSLIGLIGHYRFLRSLYR